MPSTGTLQTLSQPLTIFSAPSISNRPHDAALSSRPLPPPQNACQPVYHETTSAVQPNLTNTHAMTTRSKNNIQRPKHIPNGSIVHPLPKALLATITEDNSEPSCYIEATKHSHWCATMNLEFDALLKNQT